MSEGKKLTKQSTPPSPPGEKPVCFVIMPIADMPEYEAGHFNRVYEHLIKPAILEAGFRPLRADDTAKTDYIVAGIIQQIIQSEIMICDISGRNANVMYELGMRHAYNKPVAIIKDDKTSRIFDIQGLRHTEYSSSLRIDSTKKDIIKIAQSIRETADPNNKDVNSMVRLANIRAAEPPSATELSGETSLILSSLKTISSRLDAISSKPVSLNKDRIKSWEYVTSTGRMLKVGDFVRDTETNLEGVISEIDPMEGYLTVMGEKGSRYIYSLEESVLSSLEAYKKADQSN